MRRVVWRREQARKRVGAAETGAACKDGYGGQGKGEADKDGSGGGHGSRATPG